MEMEESVEILKRFQRDINCLVEEVNSSYFSNTKS